MRHFCSTLTLALLLLSPISQAAPDTGQKRGHADVRSSVSSDVARTARKLAMAFVETAAANTLNSLAYRSIAFAGMVSGQYVVVEGQRVRADQGLIDSGLVLVNDHSHEEDAAAVLNMMRILTEIAEGRVTRKR